MDSQYMCILPYVKLIWCNGIPQIYFQLDWCNVIPYIYSQLVGVQGVHASSVYVHSVICET